MTVVIFDLDDTLYNMDTLSALPDSNEVIKTLHINGYKLAICSHNSKAESIIKRLGWFDLFDIIVGFCHDDSKEKHLQQIIDYYPLGTCFIFFDDMEKHCITASCLGMRSYKVLWKTGVTMNDLYYCNLVIE